MRSFTSQGIAGLLFSFGFAAAVAAQPVTNTVERVQDHAQIARDRVEIADARRDVDHLSDLVMNWDIQRKAGNAAAQKSIEQQIALELRQDIRESAANRNQAIREVGQSNREVRSSRREKFRDPAHPIDNRHDLRDDRRDRRDDVRDAARSQELLNQKVAVATDLRSLQRRIDTSAVDAKQGEAEMSRLLNRYLALSRQEVEMGVREFHEDKRELREDRRETREDIRRH